MYTIQELNDQIKTLTIQLTKLQILKEQKEKEEKDRLTRNYRGNYNSLYFSIEQENTEYMYLYVRIEDESYALGMTEVRDLYLFLKQHVGE